VFIPRSRYTSLEPWKSYCNFRFDNDLYEPRLLFWQMSQMQLTGARLFCFVLFCFVLFQEIRLYIEHNRLGPAGRALTDNNPSLSWQQKLGLFF
jgi:hypothetical protein